MNNRDLEVIQKVLGGEKQAYAELVDRHKDKGMALAMRMLKNREDAEEALQDAFIRAFKALPRFEWKSSFATWFYRIVYNVCASVLTKKGGAASINREGEEVAQSLEFASNDPLPDVEYESNEFQRIVQEETEKLPATYASVLTLFFVQELSYEEIADVMDAPLGTVKNRLFRARSLLRAAVLKRLGSRPSGVQKEKVA
jgi:RNA polymerase sigma-70 factor (ECF subfamily)